MPWFKVDDAFAHHSKALAAGNAAIGLWTRAGAWSMQQLTDGFIPTHVARTLGTPAEARKLLQVGLWVEADGGYRFHEWTAWQPSKEKVEAERHAARERQQRAREAAKSRRDSRGTSDAVTVPPTRPDPTRPVLPTEVPQPPVDESPGGQPDKPAPRTRPKRRLPDDFRPGDEHQQLADELGVDLHAQWPRFVDHWRSTGETKADWPATLRNWIRRAADRGETVRGRTNGAVRHLPHVSELEQPPDGLSPTEYAAWERQRRERRRA